MFLLAVPHDDFLAGGADTVRQWLKFGGLVFYMKAVLPRDQADLRV